MQLAASRGYILCFMETQKGGEAFSESFQDQSHTKTHINTHNWSCVYDCCIIYQLVRYYRLQNTHMNHNNFMLQGSSEKTLLIFSQLIGLARRPYEVKRQYLHVCEDSICCAVLNSSRNTNIRHAFF